MSPRRLAELSVAIALAAVLSLIKIKLPHLVYGGSVSLHAMPLVVVALRHGIRAGVLAGAAYGAVNFVMTPYFIHPIQLILDYPVAFGSLGLAGIATACRAPWLMIAAVAGAGIVRLAVHTLSGVVYFSDLAPVDTPVWEYSLLYNSSYMIPETVLTCLGSSIVIRRLHANPDSAVHDHPPEETKP